MVCGVRAAAHRHLSAAEVRRNFVRVDFQAEAELFCLLQVVRGVLDIKDAGLGENVREFRKVFFFDLRHDLGQHVIEKFALLALPFGEHAVGPQKGANHIDRMSLVEYLHRAEHAELGILIHAVAALALDRGHAEAEHGVEPLFADRNKVLDRGSAGRGHGCVDAAALFHNREIAFSL